MYTKKNTIHKQPGSSQVLPSVISVTFFCLDHTNHLISMLTATADCLNVRIFRVRSLKTEPATRRVKQKHKELNVRYHKRYIHRHF